MKQASFGELIRSSRRKLGKTLQDVADALNVSVVYVSEVERGKRPPFVQERLKTVAKHLEIDFQQLQLAAIRGRRQIDFDPEMASIKQVEALSCLARGGLTEEQLDEILAIVNSNKVRKKR